jgi:hypothetical protein
MNHFKLKIAALCGLAVAVACHDIPIPADQACGTGASKAANFTELAEKLSCTAQIYVPGTLTFEDPVARWSNLSTPVANVVVVPSTENDISETVSPFPVATDFLVTTC